MAYWIIDLRDREAQQVRADTPSPESDRFVKIEADTAKEAFSRSGMEIEASKELSK